jgi:hypothetical protein
MLRDVTLGPGRHMVTVSIADHLALEFAQPWTFEV